MNYLECAYCGGRHVSMTNIEICRKIKETRTHLKKWQRGEPTTTGYYTEITYLLHYELRRAICKRFNQSCSRCNAGGVHLEVHHITPVSQGGDNTLSNLTPLCVPCHHFVHSKKGRVSATNFKLDEIGVSLE